MDFVINRYEFKILALPFTLSLILDKGSGRGSSPRLQNLRWSLANRCLVRSPLGINSWRRKGNEEALGRGKSQASVPSWRPQPSPLGAWALGKTLQKCPKLGQDRYFCTHFFPFIWKEIYQVQKIHLIVWQNKGYVNIWIQLTGIDYFETFWIIQR